MLGLPCAVWLLLQGQGQRGALRMGGRVRLTWRRCFVWRVF